MKVNRDHPESKFQPYTIYLTIETPEDELILKNMSKLNITIPNAVVGLATTDDLNSIGLAQNDFNKECIRNLTKQFLDRLRLKIY